MCNVIPNNGLDKKFRFNENSDALEFGYPREDVDRSLEIIHSKKSKYHKVAIFKKWWNGQKSSILANDYVPKAMMQCQEIGEKLQLQYWQYFNNNGILLSALNDITNKVTNSLKIEQIPHLMKTLFKFEVLFVRLFICLFVCLLVCLFAFVCRHVCGGGCPLA